MSDFTLSVDPRAHVAVITWTAAKPTIELIRAAFDALLARTDFEPAFAIVSDWRLAVAAPEPMFAHQFVAALETQRAAGAFKGRWATVVPKDPALYGMGRMTESLSTQSDIPYRVFEHLTEAFKWARSA